MGTETGKPLTLETLDELIEAATEPKKVLTADGKKWEWLEERKEGLA